VSAGLRALAAKAVPGGWGAFGQPGGDPWLVINRGGGLSIMVTGLDVPDPEPTARFIAACDPQTILALLDERDAAIRRTESLLDIFDRATTSNNDSTPLYDYLGDDARATVDAARTIVALRAFQESGRHWRANCSAWNRWTTATAPKP